jgi:small-conductance mechanosensitive channel
LFISFSLSALAQTLPGSFVEHPAPTAPRPSEETLGAVRAALTQELAEVELALESATQAQDATAIHYQQAVREVLEHLDRLYTQHLTTFQREKQLAQDLRAVQELLQSEQGGRSLAPPPYTLITLDKLQDEFAAAQQRLVAVREAQRAAEDALTQAQEQRDDAERARRQAREIVEKNTDAARADKVQRNLRLAQVKSRVANALVQLRSSELKNERATVDLQQQKQTLLARQVAWVQERLTLTSENLQTTLTPLIEQENELRRDLEIAEQELANAERQWATVQQRLDQVGEPSPLLVEEVEARRLERQAKQESVTILGKRLARMVQAKTAWQRRYRLRLETMSGKERREWRQETAQALEEFEHQRPRIDTHLSSLQTDLVAVQTKTENARATNMPSLRWLRLQERALTDLIQTVDADRTSLVVTERLYQRLLNTLRTQSDIFSLRDYVQGFADGVVAVWRYEILAVEDYSLRVSTLLAALLLLTFGGAVARYISRMFGRRVLRRLGLEAGAATAFETLLFYLFVVIFTLIALRTLRVPLTVFTIFGGALAIAVGFGSQTLLSNFISGIILLAERPIRVGDMVDVEGTYGIVEHVGFRSTRVRSFENIYIIVPNSAFLEKNVINWTLSDDSVRVDVHVGVAYGSPVRMVAQIIRQAVDEHEKILTYPEPIVLFADFGNSSLNFEVHFWIRMKKLMDRRIVESDLRYRIDELFHQAGIVIAFPQRDVHLNTTTPVQVQVLNELLPTVAEKRR